MSHNATAPLLDAAVRIPDHVVFRSFVQETIVLNLETSSYHGLNATAGAMFSALEAAGSVRDALGPLAEAFPAAGDRLAGGLMRFCEMALQRGLIELGSTTAFEP